MKKFITISIVVATFLGAFAIAQTIPAFAQEEQVDVATPLADASKESARTGYKVLVAQVDILGTNIQKIDEEKYLVVFSLKSSDVITQNAYSRVVLLDANDNLVYIGADGNALELPPNNTRVRNIEFVPPQGLNGTFTVMVYVTNAEGLPLATGNAGQITLAGETTETVTIKQCSTKESSYEPLLPVTVTCELTGKIPENATIIGTAFASRSSKPAEVVTTEISKNVVTYSFSTLANPGGYEIVSQLFVSDKAEGQSAFTGMNVSGKIANITNVILDKEVYTVGETAKITGALQVYGYQAKELFVTVNLKANDGTVCGEQVTQEVTVPNSIVVDFPVREGCEAPTIEMTLEDKEGNLLDVGMSTVPPKPIIADQILTDDFPTGTPPIMVYVSLAFAFALLIALGVRKLLAGRTTVVNENINQ